ncbi:DNA-packaging protein [Paenibacillus sp. L3-i20]|uniref:DNA-packaging protein n=1 Tax=Paenibacillus sp. L3-i20 TaxID=2905833 RepID=UPI001EDF9016|nr:DNA-packaging protein [Paenibacillus sp. L3-i20]GKU79863.1 hypothetical protein L3i20_v242600 [Paenibacillus sp. L3-i20]
MSNMAVLEIVDRRLGLKDAEHHSSILSYVDEIGYRIMHYCGLDNVPDGLKYVWASMTIDVVRIELPHISEIADTVGDGAVNISVGDTSSGGSGRGITNTSKASIEDVVTNYRVDLNRYRKMRW